MSLTPRIDAIEDPAQQADAHATRLGYKRYSHGTSYNSGNAPTVTLFSGGGTLSSVDLADFIPYQMQDGSWRMKFEITVTLSSTSRGAVNLALNGVTFPSSYQGIVGMAILANPGNYGYALIDGPNNKINITHNASLTATGYSFSGDVKLASKPTWAY